MTEPIVVILAGVTSFAALWIGSQWLRFRPAISRRRSQDAGVPRDDAGLFRANAAVGLAAIIGGRSLTGAFVSTYVMSDAAILGISFLQGLLFFCWRETKAGRRNRRLRASRSSGRPRRRRFAKGVEMSEQSEPTVGNYQRGLEIMARLWGKRSRMTC